MVYMATVLAGCAGDPQEKDFKNPEHLKTLVTEKNQDYFLIDVRTDSEHASGHIPTSQNIPYDVLASNLPTEDRDALIIVYCQSGNRSGIATRTLEGLGFERIVDFGGITRWPWELAVPVE